MNTFTWVFAGFVAAFVVVRLWLARRQLRYVRAHRDRVPDAFGERISLAEHRKAADYTLAKTAWGRWELLVEILLLLGWTLGGGIELLDRAWRALEASELATGVGVLLSLIFASAVIDLPLAAYRTFGIEARFGFNRSTPGLFLADHLKQWLLTLLLGGPLAAALLWVLLHAGPSWWVYAWLLWLGFTVLLLWAYPVLIAPLFNRFVTLDRADLHARIEGLLRRNGLSADGIFVMDGSRRSRHGNAYFTGLGRHKRIVFFDTLLETLGAEEIEAVMAHEVGHFKRHHLRKRLLSSAALSLAGLALLAWLMGQDWFYHGLGVGHATRYLALPLFMLVLPVFTFFLQPVPAWISRRHEFEADDFAAEQADARTLIQALVKLYSENASTLTPDPLYSAFYDSHPPAPVRVAHLSRHAAGP